MTCIDSLPGVIKPGIGILHMEVITEVITVFSNSSLTMVFAWGILEGWANNVLSFIENLEIVIDALASHAPGKWFCQMRDGESTYVLCFCFHAEKLWQLTVRYSSLYCFQFLMIR